MSWNAGGLPSHMYQEFLAWCDMQWQLDIIVVQETHWHETSDYVSGSWLVLHSSGRGPDVEFGRCSGLLFLINQRVFKDPRILEVMPGRLALIQMCHKTSNTPISLIGVYQHVWRSGLTTAKNKELRQGLWTHLDGLIMKTPARHHLIISGDFNTTVRPDHPVVGPCVPADTTDTNGGDELQMMLRTHNLTVLNTWQTKHPSTYYAPTGETQIDYVIVRQDAAVAKAKQASPDRSFPIGGGRLTGHFPIRAELPLLPIYFSQKPGHSKHVQALDVTALQAAVRARSTEAQLLCQNVSARLSQIDTSQIASAHASVNRILLEEAALAFPREPKPDHRVSAQPGFRITARAVWQTYRQFKRAGVCTFGRIFDKWRLATSFAKASKALRQQSKELKRAFYEEQIGAAELAAARGDQRSLFLIIRRLSPKTRKIAGRMRGEDGHLLSPAEEMEAIIRYSKTFAARPDEPHIAPLTEDLVITDQALLDELSKLGIGKAVPKHIAPAAVWRLCATSISHALGQALRQHLRSGSQCQLDEDWKHSHVSWIPKPSKAPTSVEALRPIGLTSPASKALAGCLRSSLVSSLQPLLQQLPQFAYAKQRGTFDAIIRAHQHFEAVAEVLQQTKCNRFQQRVGKKQRPTSGGLGLSLDLSKAFDGVDRPEIYRSMSRHGVPSSTITLVQQLHADARYIFHKGDLRGSVITSNGIKQGCVIAPFLWNYFSISFLLLLRDQRSQEWIERVLSLFADDVWGAWVIRGLPDLRAAIDDVTLILETLETLHMQINYGKTAILLRLVGKDAKQQLREHTYMHAGQLHLRLTVHGRECGVPIKDQHLYLGTVVTYKHRLDRNMTHRIQASQVRYQSLRKLLNGNHHLTTSHRLRLWQACICSSVMYSQAAVGVTERSLRKLTVYLTKQLRAILRVPAHITHITTGGVWQQAGLPMPGWSIQHTLRDFLQKLERKAFTAADITTGDQAFQHLRLLDTRLDKLLMEAAVDLAKEPLGVPLVNCPHCNEAFHTENSMRIHSKLKHGDLPAHSTRTPTAFRPELHSLAGMPACRLCSRQFFRWSHLRIHIESGACSQLGGDSLVRAPIPDEQAAEIIQAPPAVHRGIFADENAAHTPLVMRAQFQQKLHDWESWLKEPAVRQELSSHCVLCNMWISSYKHVKQHFNKVHAAQHPTLMDRALKLSLTFKSHLTRDRSCLWCHHKVGAPGRHVQQCTPLVQLTHKMFGGNYQMGNDELEIFASCWGGPEYQPPPPRGPKRHRPEQQPHWGHPGSQMTRHPGGHFGNFGYQPQQNRQDQLRLLTRVVLQQEETISRLRQDKVFILFMRNETDGTLASLMKVAREWRNRKSSDDPKLKSSLKTLLLASLLQEVLNQAQKAVATAENKTKMVTAGWMTQESGWTYRTWHHSEKRLCQDTQKDPLSHDEAVRVLTQLQKHVTGDVIQKFASTVGLQKLEEQGSNVATFQLEVSLRGNMAQEIYDNLSRLTGPQPGGGLHEEGHPPEICPREAPGEPVLRPLTKQLAPWPRTSHRLSICLLFDLKGAPTAATSIHSCIVCVRYFGSANNSISYLRPFGKLQSTREKRCV
ncbi:Pol [Symbiodinium sp. CCMP2592]|nr:Pol [Symbiodinium sp. CCMP2592]